MIISVAANTNYPVRSYLEQWHLFCWSWANIRESWIEGWCQRLIHLIFDLVHFTDLSQCFVQLVDLEKKLLCWTNNMSTKFLLHPMAFVVGDTASSAEWVERKSTDNDQYWYINDISRIILTEHCIPRRHAFSISWSRINSETDHRCFARVDRVHVFQLHANIFQTTLRDELMTSKAQ